MAYQWKNHTQSGDKPSARSGHSFNWVQNQNYLLYGGISDGKNGKVLPDPEVYIMKLQGDKCTWYKEQTQGAEKPLARSQHVGQTTQKADKLFIFGGHHSAQTRLNDTWILHIKEMEWRRIGGKPSMENKVSDIGAPTPRANCGSCVYKGKVIIFGGHGGINYERKNFNDVHTFDFETEQWQKLEISGSAPEGRGGCSVFAREDASSEKIFIYGGWNSEKQYNEIWQLDLAKLEWTDCDIFNGVPRWNHCSLLIEAIPTWKFFIFGGECAEYNEGAARSFGEYVNSSCYIDLGMMQWVTYGSDPDTQESGMPKPREYSAMTYDQREQRLILFGGWNNGWIDDMWSIKVSKIVGPSYAITSTEPSLGQLSGNVPITITGQGFKEVNINVLFTVGSKPIDTITKQTITVAGTHKSSTEIICHTPSFEQFGPKEAVIQLQIGNEEISTTWSNFNYFLNTRAIKSLAYGPGCMPQDVSPGNDVEFTIQARNDLGENRTSGRDVFEVTVCQYLPPAEEGAKPERIDVECTIQDLDNGKYICKYNAPNEGEVEIKVLFQDDKGNMVPLRGSPYRGYMTAGFKEADGKMVGESMKKYISTEIKRLQELMQTTKNEINTKDKDKDMTNVKQLLKVKENVEHTQLQQENINLQIDQLDESIKLLLENKKIKDADQKSFLNINKNWQDVKKLAKDVKKEIQPLVDHEKENNNKNIKSLEEDITHFTQVMKKREFFQYDCGVKTAIEKLNNVFDELKVFENRIEDYGDNAKKFGNPDLINKAIKDVEGIKITIKAMNDLWQHIEFCQNSFSQFLGTKWKETDPGDMEDQVKKLMKSLKDMKVDKRANAYNGILDEIKKWLNFLPLIGELRDQSMRDRHWDMIREKVQSNFVIDDKLYLKDIYELNLNKYKEDVEEITDQSRQEAKMEKTLGILKERWVDIIFEFKEHKGTGMQLIGLDADNFDLLENDQVSVTAMTSSRYLATFEEEIYYWQKSLAAINEVVVTCGEVQRSWSFLESLFIHSEEVKKELPNESVKFISIDKDVKTVLTDAHQTQKALDFSTKDYVLPKLDELQKELTICEKALNEFMDSKRLAFPRFFFVSPADLLDILSNGNQPPKIMCHMPKIISAMETLELLEEGVRPFAKGMHACVGKEYVEFTSELKLLGKVEIYLQDVINTMRSSLKDISIKSLKKFSEIDKESWLIQDPAMVTLLINNCSWVISVEKSFANFNSDKNSVKKAHESQINDLKGLIMMVQGDLAKPVRQKIMCMITMDAHSRDIIDELVRENVTKVDEFQWQRQLKGMFDSGQKDFVFKIADACLNYGYEYLGNGPRLVITPLTDRIYVTATQALHLKMGCAPAGPAGTGKTESTKDLASALGKACYVFNCSDQMDYQTMAGIFKGLAASGSWGCFDEFNRLVPAVLSVCSVQFKAVCDAILAGASRFDLQGDEVNLDPTCGAFITMNPGYLGRSELPEGLKALFRPITVVVPDLELICENMLMAEGFTQAKPLAKKFTTLYFLCRDLLSKAAHYDWGLRAIKSVLNVAGAMKRDEPDLPESAILLRALRDFNLPKIVADDLDIFYGLLGDLFPGIKVERKRDMKLEGIITECVKESGLYEEPEFILKVVQLSELLAVRHCVFTMGPPGAGKSSTWQMLGKAQTKDGRKTTIIDLNPKVTSTNELYGFILLATREWKDGLLSNKMRQLANMPDTDPKWIILDGDLDANWIESMNSVMDDNKLLTLASNERISLKPHMRLIFEIRDLRFATPATVSRAGILYISDDAGYQWRAYVKSWLSRLKTSQENLQELESLFQKYVPDTLLHCAKSFKHIIPQVQISMVVSICKLVENLILHNDVKSIEWVFIFACVWCIGGGFGEKDGKDYRSLFDKYWRTEKGKVFKFPNKGTIFQYFYDIENNKPEEWGKLATGEVVASIDTSKSIQSYTVPTSDTISAQFIMKQFVQINHSSMLSGQAGFGKTQIIKGLLNELCSGANSDYIQQIVNFNFYTTANLLQLILQQQLEKKAGRLFAPQGSKKLIYFVDDLNMPGPDPYDTQTAIALLRQHRDYEHWYDKNKLSLMDIKNTQLIAAMNPTAGTFYINPRLQRHFWLLSVGMPESSSLSQIYMAYLTKHFHNFKSAVNEQVQSLVKSTLQLFNEVAFKFRKTAQNFHYEFNVRHLTNVFQGLLQAKPEAIKEPENLIRLWVHECERIFGDRLVDAKDLALYRSLAYDCQSKSFSKFNLKKYFGANPEPLIFAQFVGSLDDKLYDQFPTQEAMANRLQEGLREYNDVNAVMDLVLFDDAMKHVCKICRIIASDQGHALLVGVGGSGKQSLTRLSSFMCQYTTVGIVISSSYGMGDLKTDLQTFYMKSGGKDEGLCFLFTEGQITKEEFLVYINDLLSSGEIADLFQAEDIDGIVNQVRGPCKSEGLGDTPQACMKFFYDRVRKNLHMSLCFSPVGDAFRNRAKKFPALVNCSVIDWFHPWPEEALHSVAEKFLAEVEMASDEIRQGITKFMPYSFKVVNDYSQKILDQERRFVYTTPKSFLELIKLFKVMFAKKEGQLAKNLDTYETGVLKLTETGEVVAKLEEDLKVMSVEVEAKKKSADEQATIVGAEKAKVEVENNKAEAEAVICNKIKADVEKLVKEAQESLDKAEPLVAKAEAALAGLDINDFRNLKALKKPPEAINETFTCVLHLLCSIHKDIPVKGGKLAAPDTWKVALSLMSNPQAFLDELMSFKPKVDDDKVPAKNFAAIRETLDKEDFNPESIAKKSGAAGGLCDWIINITAYYDVVVSVEPLRNAVKEGKERLEAANSKKAEVDALVAKLNSELQVLLDQYNFAMKEKNDAIAAAAKCERKMNLATRLVGALGSEQDRWAQSIVDIGELLNVIIGDVLLASAFVSYVGPFNKKFRDDIILKSFLPFFKDNNIPMSENSNPVTVLTDDATCAGWFQNALPPDRVSIENGCILNNSERYSLIIDPQLQGITWLRKTYDPKGLKVTRLTNPKMVKTIEFAVEQGDPVLIENLQNNIDAVIQPVYARAIIKKGKSKYIKLGDKELTLSPDFNLFMHTKLSNPHYPPEIQAECTLINFTVTEAGLEDQLLSIVVEMERPDLAAQKKELVQQQNEFKIKLGELEADLLRRLAEAKGDILDDIELIESLEFSKKLSTEINEKVEKAKVTEEVINTASESYRPAAERGALVFFLLNELYKIHSFYKFSLDSFIIVVRRAIKIVADSMKKKKIQEGEGEGQEGEEPAEGEAPKEAEAAPEEEEEQEELSEKSLKARVQALVESITYQGFNYCRRGTFEDHKLIISTMLCFRILIRQGIIRDSDYQALIKKDPAQDPPHQPESLKFLQESMWPSVKGLENLDMFSNLTSKMESEALMWRKWYSDERPESCDLPKSFASINLFQRCLLLRAMRPDRLTNALKEFVQEHMGIDYVEAKPFDINLVEVEMNKVTPTFFVLFPGVDPTPEVEHIGRKNNKIAGNGTFINISMGQGQEKYAIKCLKDAGKAGNWVMFQNVHLMTDWMKDFEFNLEVVIEEGAHDDFRCFISSEPPPLPYMEIIPESILQNSLKIANEAPKDLKSNIRRAFSKFGPQHFEKAKTHKELDFKALLFGLCMYHSLILGRTKFGSQGWSRKYNYNDGDLRICGEILHNYLAAYEKVPYTDLQYLYGEVMYGGHITDNWDRRTNATYLKKLIRPQIMENMQLTMSQGFRSPNPAKTTRELYEAKIDELPPENPNMFGLHSNAEIGYLTNLSEALCMTILQCGGSSAGAGGKGKDQEVQFKIDTFLSKLPEEFNMIELRLKAKERTPYVVVCLQECERMNFLIFTIRTSLEDLDQGMKGQLNITENMEKLAESLFINQVPALWEKYAYASKKDLQAWFDDLLLRIQQLVEYSEELIAPKSLWISGLFNPMSYLTAIMQVTARTKGLALDNMILRTTVLNIDKPKDIAEKPEDGAYIHGFFLQGAKWEPGRGQDQGNLMDMVPKELYPELPVVHVTSIEKSQVVKTGFYDCPVYVTTARGGTYVFTANLKMESEEPDAELYWILAGVALFMQYE